MDSENTNEPTDTFFRDERVPPNAVGLMCVSLKLAEARAQVVALWGSSERPGLNRELESATKSLDAAIAKLWKLAGREVIAYEATIIRMPGPGLD